MNKTVKFSISLILAIIIVGGLSFYFYNEFYLAKQQTDPQKLAKEISTFKYIKSDITPEVKDKIGQSFNKAAQIYLADPTSVGSYWPLIDIGNLKQQVSDYTGAEQAWLAAAKIQPQAYPPFLNLGNLYFHFIKDFAKAEQAYLTVIKNKPEEITAYSDLYQIYRYFYKQDSGLAEKILLQGIENNPKEVGLMEDLIGYYKSINDNAKAIDWCNKILAIDPQNDYAKKKLVELQK